MTTLTEPTPLLRAALDSRGAVLARRHFLAIILVVLCIVARFSSDVFFTQGNILNVLNQASVIGVLAIGMTFVVLTGGIDLSVGSMLAAVSVYMGLQHQAGSGALVMLGAALIGGVALGAFNGLAVTVGRVVPFIATLAMLSAARGLALTMNDAQPITITDDTIRDIGRERIFGVPLPVYVFAVMAVLGWLLLNRTTFGRHVVAIGGNAEAARLSGIRVQRTQFLVYALSGLCVSVAAVLLTARLGSASPTVAGGYELDAIAAVVIGGTSLSGGRGTLEGSVIGVLLFNVLFNLFNLLNVSAHMQGVLKGVIILAAVVVQRRTGGK